MRAEMSLNRQPDLTLLIGLAPEMLFYRDANEITNKKQTETKGVKVMKFTKKIITVMMTAALAATMMFGGATAFAAQAIDVNTCTQVEFDRRNTQTNLSFRPAQSGEYTFESSMISDEALKPSIKIYQGSTLQGEAGGNGENYSLTLTLEAGKNYQVKAIGYGLRNDEEASYILTVTTNIVSDLVIADREPTAEANIAPVEPSTPSTPAAPAAPAASTASTPAASIVASDPNASLKNFVERLYRDVLGRQFDVAGRDHWVDMLLHTDATGSSVANGFFNSQEFINKKMSNEQFVATLYRVFFDRTASASEIANWTTAMDNGATRAQVIAGFEGSQEWARTCAYFGINV